MNKLMSKTFLWMFLGLIVTFMTGYIVAVNENMLETVFGGPLFYILIILELVLVIFFSARVHKMQPTTAKICFLLYSFVSGLTFSSIFIAFELSSIMLVFLIAALVFAIFGALGYFTKIDLSKLGTILFMGLIAVIICMIVNMFLNNSSFDLIISIIALLVFFGYVAFDIQKIKRYYEAGIDSENIAILGAFELYLDFINIFIHLLQIIGDAKD